jgi:hypothetical protein
MSKKLQQDLDDALGVQCLTLLDIVVVAEDPLGVEEG